MPGGGAALHETAVVGDVRRVGVAPGRGDEEQAEFLRVADSPEGLSGQLPRHLHDLLGRGGARERQGKREQASNQKKQDPAAGGRTRKRRQTAAQPGTESGTAVAVIR